MIKQNIKIAIVAIISIITFWLVMFNFIKIDKVTSGVISVEEYIPVLYIDNETSAYMTNKNISGVKVEIDKQYFYCNVTLIPPVEEAQSFRQYQIFLPEGVYYKQEFLETNVIVDSLNLYQHWFKK